jgi:hypothetical protein
MMKMEIKGRRRKSKERKKERKKERRGDGRNHFSSIHLLSLFFCFSVVVQSFRMLKEKGQVHFENIGAEDIWNARTIPVLVRERERNKESEKRKE